MTDDPAIRSGAIPQRLSQYDLAQYDDDPPVNDGPVCGCGCGAPVRRRFLPGHNARPPGTSDRSPAERQQTSQLRRKLRNKGLVARTSGDFGPTQSGVLLRRPAPPAP
jgi:hypothetical protein